MLGPPADVVEHDGRRAVPWLRAGRFISSIGTRFPWSASVLVITTWPLPSGRQCEFKQTFGEVAGRKQFEQPELVLPAQAVGLELVEQVEDGQVAAELLARGFAG